LPQDFLHLLQAGALPLAAAGRFSMIFSHPSHALLRITNSARLATITAVTNTAGIGAICHEPEVSPTAHRYRKAHGWSIRPTLMAYMTKETHAIHNASPR
jgi:hypothetical protein